LATEAVPQDYKTYQVKHALVKQNNCRGILFSRILPDTGSPFSYEGFKGKEVLTCSDCVNSSLLNSFSRSWTSRVKDVQKAESDYNLDLETISNIHVWTDQNDASGKIGYINVFSTLELATEYHQKFFSHLDKVKLLGLYLPESDADGLIEDFKEVNRGEDGIRLNLKKKERETSKGIELGFDLIGLSPGGRFHTFHCHYLAGFFEKEFNVKVNEFGLIEDDLKRQELTEYMNDKNSGVEPDPWYFAKLKLF
jgi:hypothetical protein